MIKSFQKAGLSVCDESSSFLQSGFWGAFKSRFGWEALAFLIEWEITEKVSETRPLLVLRRPLVPGSALAYIPWGPELPISCSNFNEALLELVKTLKAILPKDTVFIRFDPPWYQLSPYIVTEAVQPPFIRSAADIQPPDTVLLNLSQSMGSLLEEMKPKWRYNARLALKKGVKVYQAGLERITCFHELLKETAKRDGIAIHSLNYYKDILENSWYKGQIPDIRLYLAEHENELLAGIVTLFRGGEAVYLYGASSDKKRNLMASYALQVKAIEDAKSSGCLYYDFFGIPPNSDPSHPMAGLYRFKTGFGGSIIHRQGCWDFTCRPLAAWLFRIAEKIRKKLRDLKKAR